MKNAECVDKAKWILGGRNNINNAYVVKKNKKISQEGDKS